MKLSQGTQRLLLRGAALALCFGVSGASAALETEKFKDGRKNFDVAVKLLKTKYYRSGVSDDEIYEAATRGLLEFIQPENTWDKLLSKAEYSEMMKNLEGKITGIGVVLSYSEKSGTADVIKVLPGSPSALAGVETGDRILKVDGRTFKNQEFHQMVQAIRGPNDTSVKLSVLRDTAIMDLTVKRSEVAWDTVTGEMIDGVAVLTVRSFSNNTAKQAKNVLEKLKSENPRGMVLDLRDNSGGSLDAAIDVIDLLTPKGAQIAKVEKRGGEIDLSTGKVDGYFTDLGTAVIMNEATACGAELLAATLRQTRPVTFVGEKTTGKWSVQRVEPMSNGFAVKYTTALLAPGGSKKGATLTALRPDIEVKLSADEKSELLSRIENRSERLEKDTQLRAAIEVVR